MNKKIFLTILLLATLACGLPSAAPVDLPEQPDSDSLQTFIAQTAQAAQTQTALFKPTATNTPTPTRTPSATPTATATFKFLFPTFTLIPTGTPIGLIPQGNAGGVGSGATQESIFTGQPWSCRVTSTQPPKGAIIRPETNFWAYWTIINTGTTTWGSNSVDLVYTGGYRHIGTRVQDIRNNVPTGGKIVMGAEFIAPKKEGEYGSHFVLTVGNRKFCGMEIAFEVVK